MTEIPPPTSELAAVASAPQGRFTGKVAIVTGVSDRGIGGAIAERLASEGASVLLAVHRQQPDRLVKRLERQQVPFALTACDVTQERDAQAAIETCLKSFGRLDVIVNNAGVEFAQRFDDFETDKWKALLDVNLQGAIAMSQAALPHLTQPGGVIVNIASALALGGCAGFSIYSASKAGLVGLTQSLAWELAPRGIRVVAVAPGLVSTPMVRKHIEHLTKESWDRIQACHPLGIGTPHDVASAVAFLASSDARWITGVALPLGYAASYPLPTDMFLGG